MSRAGPLLLLFAISAGCLGATTDDPTDDQRASASGEPAWERTYVHDGALGPTAPTARFAFNVDPGAAEVEALLTWHDPVAQLGFRLLDPAGEEAAAGWNEAPGRAYVTTTRPVEPGEWTIEISSTTPTSAGFAATLNVRSDARPFGPLATSFTLPPADPSRALPPEARGAIPLRPIRDYAEVNLNMRPGDAFNFSWTSTAPVYFNVHYHGENGTQRPIEERSASLQGNFTATMTEVYALLWRNEGTSEVDVTLELNGTYRLHSMTRAA